MSCLRFHSSASSDTLRVARASSDTTEHERDRAAARDGKMDPAATYAVIVALFFAAGVLEIGGGWMWWQALREGKPWWYALIGSAMLCLYGVVPTFQPQTAGTEDFGRVRGLRLLVHHAVAGLGLGRRRQPARRGRRHRRGTRGRRRGRHHVLSALVDGGARLCCEIKQGSKYKKPN